MTPTPDRYHLTPEQAFALARRTTARPSSRAPSRSPSPPSGRRAGGRRLPHRRRASGWHEHDPDLFEGTERFFRPGYAANLVDDVAAGARRVGEKLTTGARVADVGCGHGASTIIMAKAFPASPFVGFDYHGPSIDRGPPAAASAGVADRCDFEVADAADFPGTDYDLVAFFDCLHDMGDPVGAARHVRESLAPGRHLAAGRAVRQRPRRGQPQPGRPDLLQRLDADLRAGVARPGGRRGARRPGRRGRHPPRSPRRPASAGSAGPPRPRSTSSSKTDPDGRPAAGPTQRNRTP